MIIITIVIIILLWSILIGFQCDWYPCWCCLILIWSSLCWSGGSWLGCWYCWPQGLFYPAGVRLQANCRVVLGTWPPLAINFVNSKKKQGWWSCGWLETSKIRFMFMNGISKEKDLKISKCNLAWVNLVPMHPVVGGFIKNWRNRRILENNRRVIMEGQNPVRKQAKFSRRIRCSSRRILQFLMPNEHPEWCLWSVGWPQGLPCHVLACEL